MAEQMALDCVITSRAPQRYLIHNTTGLPLWYWATGVRKTRLDSYCSEELAVAPRLKVIKLTSAGGRAMGRQEAHVINMQFDGNWVPLEHVAVDIVGKYRYKWHHSAEGTAQLPSLKHRARCGVCKYLQNICKDPLRIRSYCSFIVLLARSAFISCYAFYFRYYLRSPQQDVVLPVIVDVVLIGRTKMLRIHSAVRIDNSTHVPIRLLLHLPEPSVRDTLALDQGDEHAHQQQAVRLAALMPGEGR